MADAKVSHMTTYEVTRPVKPSGRFIRAAAVEQSYPDPQRCSCFQLTRSMFIGELLCCLPLIWGFMTAKPKADKDPQASVFTRILSRIPLGTASTTTPNQYAPVHDDDDSSEDGEEDDEAVRWQAVDNSLSGWRMCLMWFPAFFDSAFPILCPHTDPPLPQVIFATC
jgi:hypothetical protein